MRRKTKPATDGRTLEQLRNLPVGGQLTIGTDTITTKPVVSNTDYSSPCTSCTFHTHETGFHAGTCPYRTACMAHLRKDRTCVIFKKL